jgi:riboflavin kinase / FMN adenylyltransferase
VNGVATGAAVSVGVFDGVHLGHQRILATALERATRAPHGHPGGRCVVVSFDPHPDVVLDPAFRVRVPLTPLSERRERLAALGIRELEIVPFTRELAALEPEAFVARHLSGPYRMHTLVVGEGFALGRGRSGDVPRLRTIGERAGFEVVAVPLLDLDGAPVSSTRIRGLLEAGRVAVAARLLGRCYDLRGRVVSGEAIGRTLGFPTANLRLHEEKLVPADGVYAARARIGGADRWFPAAMSIGLRPTFDGPTLRTRASDPHDASMPRGPDAPARTLEAHLLDWDGELLGRDLEVELVDWVRPQVRFAGRAELAEQMGRDVEEIRRRLAAAPPTPGLDPPGA